VPGNPRAIVAEAERQFPIRIAIKVPPAGFGERYTRMMGWLDENCGVGAWAIAPAGTRGLLNDAISVYLATPTCAVGFVIRWLVPGDPAGFYEVREDEPARRVPAAHHKTP